MHVLCGPSSCLWQPNIHELCSSLTYWYLAGFVALILISAAAGFSPPDYKLPTYKQSDKALHFVAFFLLTLTFYWILETSRRKVLQLTFTVCTVVLGIASEVVQGLLPVRMPLVIHMNAVMIAKCAECRC